MRLRKHRVASCLGHTNARLNVDISFLTVLTVVLVRHYPQAKAQSKHAPVVRRLEEHVSASGGDPLDLMAWLVALEQHSQTAQATELREEERPSPANDKTDAVLLELVEMNRKLSEGLRVCESALLAASAKRSREQHDPDQDQAAVEPPEKRRKHSAATSLRAMRYE